MNEFKRHIEKQVEIFKNLQNKHVRVISHLDCDGLTSAAIIIKALLRANLNFSTTIVKQIDITLLDELSKENYNCYIFTDLGSGYLSLISEKLESKAVFVLDHHKPEDVQNRIHHTNPHNFGIDGGKDISGAGVTYLFAKKLNEENKDMAHLAIIGAIGDIQEGKGFHGLNKEILEDAIQSGKIEVKKGLGMFGSQTKPLHKVLEFSTDPYIPGVTGSEQGAIKFLNELGISIKDQDGKYKKLIHLNEQDIKKLTTGIILKRLGSEKNPEDILGNIYLLTDELEESPTKDAREFSTLLNSCGRLRKPSLGIGTCLGNKKIKKEAVALLSEYKQELIKSLNWFYSKRGSPRIIEEDGYTIINAEENIKDTIIGTLASIVSRSNIYRPGTIIVSMANTIDGNIKISLRLVGTNKELDLREFVKKITKKLGVGEAGGHKQACGCLIPQEKEEEFIKISEEILKKMMMEETIGK
ncbi:MAG: DHH family phosphoesterase [Nanoarchaeota archaeon]|nr:DHH family phosphoesterase [Nanoarchaeota archaeon]MCG2718581.1 DHH family phosphoesterase [Nanoarchaeota archaeon]